MLPSRLDGRRYVVEMAVLLALSALSFGQSASAAAATAPQASSDAGDSLGAAARKAKAQNAVHAKKVFTDEDMDAKAGPLPRLKMDGAENADEVMAAIAKYKLTHTPQQTEEAVRGWYDRYDQELAAAIQETIDVRSLRSANMSNGNELCQHTQDYEDYAHCQSRQVAEQRGARQDQAEINNNNNVVVRIQHSFMKIRVGLTQNGVRYDWFKVRTSNNIDRF
ncbi:MAG TPA: hypothetical protein VKR60_02775 [Candidatus Sulfotelmatobacter sp.]|nr:hypothetical protein [Candidatus Sulfotelmatobacter sp.]